MSDVLVMGRKRKPSGYDYISQRQERVEAQLYEQKGENTVLQRMSEEHKESVEELTEQLRATKVSLEEQKSNVQQLTDELSIRNSRVMQLEADRSFFHGRRSR